jgi:hypothetical protein
MHLRERSAQETFPSMARADACDGIGIRIPRVLMLCRQAVQLHTWTVEQQRVSTHFIDSGGKTEQQ